MKPDRIEFVASCLVVMALSAVQPQVAVGGDLYFDASAYAPGAGGSEWVHEVEVCNPLVADLGYRLYWLPQGQDNSNATFVDLVVDAGRCTRFDNLLVDVFGLAPGVVGAVRIVPAGDGLRFHSRLVNKTNSAKYGEIIPATPELHGFGMGEDAYIIHAVEDDSERTNLLCLNTTVTPITVSYELRNGGGAILDTRSMVLPPRSNAQHSGVFAGYAPVAGYLRLWTDTPGGRAICESTVIDNITNDGRYQLAIKPPEMSTEYYVPYAVGDPGGIDTDLSLFSPTESITVQVDLLETGSDNSMPQSADVPVAAGENVRISNVLNTLFLYAGTAALRLSTTGSGLMASVQNATPAPAGRMIRTMSPIAGSSSLEYGRSLALIHLTEELFTAAAVGAVNASATEIDLEVDLHDASGQLLATVPMHLLPFSHVHQNRVFDTAGHPDVADGFAIVRTTTPGGSFVPYATVTDLVTFDAYHVTSDSPLLAVFADGFESGDTSAWSATVP